MSNLTRARVSIGTTRFADVVSPSVRAEKLITFTGAADLGAVGAVPLFTVTGAVMVDKIMAVCETDLVGATATLALGVTGATTLLIAATTATDIDVDELWVSNAPNATGIALPAGLQNILIHQNIIGTVATAAITAGAIRLVVLYTPISLDGEVVAA